MVRITPKSEPYEVSETFNDLTGYWTDFGYFEEGNELVRIDEISEEIEEITPVSDIEAIKVSKFRRKGSVVALRRRFGDLAYGATHVIINSNLILPINRLDRRVELSKYFLAGQFVDVQLATPLTITTPKRIEDRIPIVEVTYSVFIKGEYKPRGKPVDRKFYVNGDKRVRVGAREPFGVNAQSFWSRVFNDLKRDTLDEMMDKITSEWEFSGEMVSSNYTNTKIVDGFPKNKEEFRGGL